LPTSLRLLSRGGIGFFSVLIPCLLCGLFVGWVGELLFTLDFGQVEKLLFGLGELRWWVEGLLLGLFLVLAGLFSGLGWWLKKLRAVLVTTRTAKEAYSRSLTAAFCVGLGVLGLGMLITSALVLRLSPAQEFRPDPAMQVMMLSAGLFWVLCLPLFLGLTFGGWFALLQKGAHWCLAKAGNLPPHPAEFLEWGIERQIFRRVGGGVRFRHNLIQQHLANTSAGEPL
jgi:hypothetical protein